MATNDETNKTVVKTYVPGYQKEAWSAHATELDMSQSEFVRSMVQAGRKGFEQSTEKDQTRSTTPGGDALETRVLELLENEPHSWEALLDALKEDFEERLEDVVTKLQSANEIHHSGPKSGYTITSDGHGS